MKEVSSSSLVSGQTLLMDTVESFTLVRVILILKCLVLYYYFGMYANTLTNTTSACGGWARILYNAHGGMES
jgi:hypothetical protein